MKIAVLNECFLTSGHKDRLKKLGELLEYTNTTTEDLAIERLTDIDIAIVDGILFPSTQKVLESTSKLKLLVLNTTGYDSVHLETAKQKDIKVANAASYATEAVAEETFMLMLGVARNSRMSDKFVRERPSEMDPGHKEHQHLLGFELKGKTLGVVGLGNIGQRVAEIGTAFGMNVIGYNHSPKPVPSIQKQVSLEELLKESDVVSLHVAYTPETEHIISKKELEIMKPTAILINTARGKLINTQDLYDALVSRKIAGAGLDVLEDWSSKDPLLKLDSVILSPHCAFYTKEALNNLSDILISNVESFIQGAPQNIVN